MSTQKWWTLGNSKILLWNIYGCAYNITWQIIWVYTVYEHNTSVLLLWTQKRQQQQHFKIVHILHNCSAHFLDDGVNVRFSTKLCLWKKKPTEIEAVIKWMIAFGVCEQPKSGSCFLDCVHNKHVLCNNGGLGGGIVQGESEMSNGTMRFLMF